VTVDVVMKDGRVAEFGQDAEAPMTMLKTLKTIATRSQDTLLQDAVGAAALVVMLVVGLHLPSFV